MKRQVIGAVLRGLLVIVSVSSLAACATIPSDSGVQTGAEIKSVSGTDFMYFSPYEPPENATISELLSGFLSAGTGPQNDYAVARMYLANNLKTLWQPSQKVVVVDTTPEIEVDEANSLAKVAVHATAFIDEGGRLTKAVGDSNSAYEFSFVQEAGQWRINGAPNLTVISRPVFDVVFKNYSVYFFDSQRRYLVPDVRWFPSRASTATRLVNAVIAGPDTWLQGAARDLMPSGTKLAIDAVTITDGVASVNFNTKVLTASPVVKAQIQAQLQATLAQIPGVNSVQISVERNLQNFGTFSPWDLPIMSLTPVVLTASSLSHLSGNSMTPIVGTSALIQHLHPSDFAITSQNNWVAVVNPEGLYQASLVSIGAEPTLVDARPNLLAPAYDRQGWLWSIDSGTSPKIRFFDQSQNSSQLNTAVFNKKKIVSFAVSPEGSRLAAVVSEGKKTTVWLYGLVRDKTGAPVGISGASPVSTDAVNPSSVSWLDSTSLGILSHNQAGWAEPTDLLLGGFETGLTGFSELETFIGSRASDAHFGLTFGGDLMQLRGSAWSRLQTNILRVHYPN